MNYDKKILRVYLKKSVLRENGIQYYENEKHI